MIGIGPAVTYKFTGKNNIPQSDDINKIVPTHQEQKLGRSKKMMHVEPQGKHRRAD